MKNLLLHNTLSRRVEKFTPIDPKNVTLYVCGPTVYDHPHIGNARPYVIFDVLNCLLKTLYPKVTYVQNITDIDDKIIQRSYAQKISWQDLTFTMTQVFNRNMASLNVLPPTHQPKATDHVDAMIALIKNLLSKGFAYVAENHVIFSTRTFSSYGALSHQAPDNMLSGARIDIANYKKDPIDFVLWKPAKENEPSWESPWGPGRPGWHIECSAMSAKYLGQTFDIHCGGRDLIFPHHENEIAQSCCAFSTDRMANYWMHNGHVIVEGEKMSKSLGNFITVENLLQKHPGEVIRLGLLNTHYRQPLDWRGSTVTLAKNILDKLYRAIADMPVEETTHAKSKESQDLPPALFQDLNTPLAIQDMLHMAKSIQKETDQSQKYQLQQKLLYTGQILGILNFSAKEWFSISVQGPKLSNAYVEALIEKRSHARNIKDFSAADAIRKELEQHGILLEDQGKSTSWRYVSS